jgi:hypothetical protein
LLLVGSMNVGGPKDQRICRVASFQKVTIGEANVGLLQNDGHAEVVKAHMTFSKNRCEPE